MSRQNKITKRVVDGLKVKPIEYAVWDAQLSGFGVRVRPTGAKSYVVLCRAGTGRGAPQRPAAHLRSRILSTATRPAGAIVSTHGGIRGSGRTAFVSSKASVQSSSGLCIVQVPPGRARYR